MFVDLENIVDKFARIIARIGWLTDSGTSDATMRETADSMWAYCIVCLVHLLNDADHAIC